MATPIDLDNVPATQPFLPKEWIGCGKKYPEDNTPPHILAARKQVLAIPEELSSLLPDEKLSVRNFLQVTLPPRPSTIVTPEAARAFRFEDPTDPLASLASRPLPSMEMIGKLQKAFGDAWFSGARSIVDDRFKHSRLPLYAITYWAEMNIAVTRQETWRRASRWLEDALTDNVDGSKEALSMLERLEWGSRVVVLNADANAETFATLLSNDWLDDQNIDMLMEELKTRTQLDPELARTTTIFPLVFQQIVRTAAQRGGAYSHPLLGRLKRLVDRGVRQLYFPINVNGIHWIPVMVDFSAAVIRYGDSATQLPTSTGANAVVKDLKKVLENVLYKQFNDGGNTLAHGMQDDTHSCGVCTVNTIEHALFGAKLFKPEHRRELRLMYFIRLMKAHKPDMPTPSPPKLPSQPQHPPVVSTEGEVRQSHCNLEHLDPATEGLMDFNDTSQSDWEHIPSSPATSTTTFTLISPPTSPESRPSQLTSSDSESSGSESSDNDSDGDDSDDSRPAKRKRAAHTYSTPGTSRSSLASQHLKASMRDGTLEPNRARMERFRSTCLGYDKHAEFQTEKVWRVFHSTCGKWVAMREPYDTRRFRNHARECNTESQGAASSKHSITLDSWIQRSKGHSQVQIEGRAVASEPRVPAKTVVGVVAGEEPSQVVATVTPKVVSVKKPTQKKDEPRRKRKWLHKTEETIPCRGISAALEPRVVAYLERTGAQGGGAPSVTSIARELFQNDHLVFAKLTSAQKEMVCREQSHRHSWRNDHVGLAVFSTSCEHSGLAPDGLCSACAAILYSKPFRSALRVPAPDPDNYKYLNSQYKNETVGKIYGKTLGIRELLEDRKSAESVWTRLAVAILKGKMKGQDVFLDMIRAQMGALDRLERGVGKQNFNYGAALQEFSHTTSIVSPAAYQELCRHFQLPASRTHARNRAKTPRFPTDISEETFVRARRYIHDLGYGTGPVALSCDDTKLHAAWRTYYDKEKDTHFLVGGTNGPIAVANVEEMNDILKKSSDSDKATKLRLWCLHPTLPNIPPLILAAKAIPNNLTVDELFEMLEKVLYGLVDSEIAVVSYSCDGTETERALQNLLVSTAHAHITYSIPHPVDGQPELTLRIPLIGKQPVVPVQDAKHFAKTTRNNAFSGARFITLGNFYVHYSQVRDIAFDPDGPLYHRDVEKLDRQDDNVATWLFSSATLEHVITHYADRPGLAVYLFLNGELVRAYTVPNISHLERTKMVLRTHYFYALWKKYLDRSEHPPQRHCISREALDIIRILVNGFISLMIVHRDHTGPTLHPFLPWLHSTEACEHIFGQCRKLVTDFTYQDFLYMIPQLSVVIRNALRFANSSDPRARASGYAHDWHKPGEEINLAMLSVYPDDDEIVHASREAWEEAVNLWDLLGVSAVDLLVPQQRPPAILPSISSWFPSGEDPVYDHISDFDEELFSDTGGSDPESDGEPSDAARLEKLIADDETPPLRTNATDERMLSLKFAAIALTLNDIGQVQAYEELSDDEYSIVMQEDARVVAEAREALVLPPLSVLPAEPIRPFDRSPSTHGLNVDLSGLVAVCRKHESKRSRAAVRKWSEQQDMANSKSDTSGQEAGTTQTPRQALIRAFQAALREEQDRAAGTGLARTARWQNTVAGNGAGNAANAALAAGARATVVLNRRLKIFKGLHLPAFQVLANAGIGPIVNGGRDMPLVPATFGLVVSNGRIYLGHVITFYSRGGGKAGAHAWLPETRNIGAISYIALQAYEHYFNRRFRAVHHNLATLQTFRFLHLSSDCFLLAIPSTSVIINPDGRTLELDDTAFQYFKQWSSSQWMPAILKAVDQLAKGRRKSKDSDDVSGQDH